MAEENNLKQAKAVYRTLCKMLDAQEWHYKADEEGLKIECGARGDDLPIPIRIEVDPERMLILLLSEMPFSVPESRRDAMAVAVSCANDGLVDGDFDYDYKKGNIIFRMTTCYFNCLIGKELLEYMLMCSCSTVDHYNDKLLMVATKNMTYDEIVEFIK